MHISDQIEYHGLACYIGPEFKRLCWSHVTDSSPVEASQTSDIDEVNAAPGVSRSNAGPTNKQAPHRRSGNFEDRLRDRNLQIGRVMDVLRIKEGSKCSRSGVGLVYFSRAARCWAESMLSRSIAITSIY